MDILNLAYYALVCALLSVAAPYMGRRWVRLAVGAIVGLVAASLLPLLKSLIAGPY
jgi:hypothetical protein